MMITNKLKMDLQCPGTTPRINAVQHDQYSRQLEIALFAGGKPLFLPEGTGVLIRYRKFDGRGGEYDTLPDGTAAWQNNGNLLTVRLVPQVMTCPGQVLLTVSLVRGECQLGVFPIELNVAPVAHAAEAKSENYFYVTGFLPAPPSGKPGQYFRIAAVDETGKVTAVEAVNVIAGGEVDPEAVRQIVETYLEENLPDSGKDGISATHSWNGTVLTVTSASGTSSADLKGDTGPQGAQGPEGDTGPQGAQGPKGDIGPQGVQGPKGDTGPQGLKGDTPIKGTDYWTAEDKAAIVGEALDAMNTETWIFTLADGSAVEKAVVLK